MSEQTEPQEDLVTEETVEPEPEPAVEPELEPEPEPESASAPAPPPQTVSWWPFAGYVGLWVIYAAAMTWRFLRLPQGMAVFDAPEYPIAIFVGVTLALAGPLLVLAVWIAAWGREGASRWALLVSSAWKGSLATLAGVSLWWLALLVIDQARFGRIL